MFLGWGVSGVCVGHQTWTLIISMPPCRSHTRAHYEQPQSQAYVAKITEAFHAGVLPLQVGTTLRSYLSDKLNWYVLRNAACKCGGWVVGLDGWS